MPRARSLLVLVLLVAAGSLPSATSATAAFPGANGKIAYTECCSGGEEVFGMNADGTSPTNLSNDLPEDDYDPAWSADGTKIAFGKCCAGGEDLHDERQWQ